MTTMEFQDGPWQPATNSTNGYERLQSRMPILLQYWNAVWRHRIMVLVTIAICLVAGAVLTAFATPQFSATTEIEIAREQDRVTNVDGLQSDRAGHTQEFYFTQYELLRARSLAERVVRSLGLARSEAFFAAHGELLNEDGEENVGRTGIGSAEIAKQEKRAIDLLRDHVNVVPVRGSALVSISYTSSDPVWSARVANAWAEQFIASSLDRRFASTAEAREFLEGRLQNLRERLNESERELVDYAVKQNILQIGEGDGSVEAGQTLTEVGLSDLNARLSHAASDRIEAQAKVRALSNQRENEAMIGNAALNALAERRASLNAELAGLLVQFEPNYPPARSLQSRIDALDEAIAKERSRVVRATNAELDQAISRENELRSRVDNLVGALAEEERDSIQFGILRREVDTNRQLYESLLQRYKEIGVAGVGANNISIVDRAIPPSIPSSPNLIVNVLLAAVLGSMLAGGLVLIRENLDQGIRDPGTVAQTLGVPLLGVVPEVETEDVRENLHDRKSPVSEAYATIQTNLSFSTDHGLPKVFMLTSTSKAEGKSTSSFALAQGIARMGRRVVLVDADMRLPTLDALLGARGTDGLSNYLSGDDELDKMFHATDFDGLIALPSGPVPPSTPELLGSNRLDQLTEELLKRFDHVIFDSPPMLGLADALLISRVSEGVVYITEAEREPERVIGDTIERLKRSNARIFGLILTKYSASRSGYGYGYGYEYNYRYGSAKEHGDAETAA